MARDVEMAEVLRIFAGEAEDLCGRCARDVLALEEGRPAQGVEAHLREVARALHTLKGSAGSMGYEDLSLLAHLLEDALAPHLAARAQLPRGEVDTFLQALDLISREARARPDGGGALAAVSELIDRLRLSGPGAPPAEVDDAAPRPGTPDPRSTSWRVDERSVRTLLGDIERLRELRLRLAGRQREVSALLSTHQGAVSLPLGRLARGAGADAAEATALIESLEGAVRAICTVPVRTLLEPLERTVRELCRELGKEAALATVGGGLFLDRSVLEALRGPLVHLVRNAVDHGVEPAQVRISRGKHREGALVVRVEQQGNWLFLEVSDDGQGLDTARIRAVAAARGVEGEARLGQMSEGELQKLVFRSGFSTRERISEVSGRGVGLDVVKREVEALGGTVDVTSIPGQGTTFQLAVPTDIGASAVLVVRCGDFKVGLPAPAVESAHYLESSNFERAAAGPRMHLSGDVVPVVDLAALLRLRQPLVAPDGSMALVLQVRGARVAAVVDEVVGDWELVVRPLPLELKELEAFQGAAALAEGEQLMILRPEWVLEARREPGRELSGRRVLVVDDSLAARALHRAVLEAAGYEVNAVGSARAAKELLVSGGYDALVCDVQMEEMDGLALTRWVRGQEAVRSLPVVLVSAHQEGSARERGLAAGADAWLSKQACASGKLLDEVSEALRRRRS